MPLQDAGIRAEYNQDDPFRAKLELFLILQNQRAWENLERTCQARIEDLFQRYRPRIAALSTSQRELYNKVREVAKDPEPLDFLPPTDISVRQKSSDAPFAKHLYIDREGGFKTTLNGWEQPIVESFAGRDDVVGWLRNYERKPWALRIPYDDAGTVKPTYPDFVVVRRQGTSLVVDIVEPHRPDLDDWWKKARGLAEYAKKHQMDIGRIELVRKMGTRTERLNLAKTAVYNRVLSFVTTNDHLDQVFADFAEL